VTYGYGNFALECSEGFTPADLAEAVADVSDVVELRFVGGLGRAQPGFLDAAKSASWVHFTLWDPQATGLVLTFERDTPTPAAPFTAEVEMEIAAGFSDDPMRRALVSDLATRIVERACERLAMKIAAFDAHA
jgi:hypothetical protein